MAVLVEHKDCLQNLAEPSLLMSEVLDGDQIADRRGAPT